MFIDDSSNLSYQLFAVQLLQKLHITASNNGEKLLRLVKNPVTQYLPTNSRKIGKAQSSMPICILVFAFSSY